MTPGLTAALEATWPPAAQRTLGPFTLRDGAGGGKRVSAASCDGNWAEAELSAAEAAMAEPLFLIREGDTLLDAELNRRGYRILDPVSIYAAPTARLAGEVPWLTAFPHWPPLAIARAIWAEGGVGPGRLAVMERVSRPKAAILARQADRPAGVAFAALSGTEAVVHALHVQPAHRRQGLGANLLRAAANWAVAEGATRLSLAVTDENLAARSLYARAGMEVVGQYHYRIR